MGDHETSEAEEAATDAAPAETGPEDPAAPAEGSEAPRTDAKTASLQAQVDDARSKGLPVLDVTLPIFEGPLDLLLHLVREHKLDIFDIPISFVTEKYMEMVEKMRELNLDIAGEYLLMAATLAHIKSKMLLPRAEVEEADEEEEDGDPRESLVRRLLEYQKYKEAGENLGRQDILGRDVFSREVKPGKVPLDEGDVGYREVSVFKLIEALAGVLSRAKEEVQHEVELERVSVSARIQELLADLKARGSARFVDLFEKEVHRSRIIVTFLALLEMARLGFLRIHQSAEAGPASEIQVSVREEAFDTDPSEVQDDFR